MAKLHFGICAPVCNHAPPPLRLQFERKNFKYWVHPANVLRLKLACARHLPVLVYGQCSPLEAGETDPESLRHDGSAITGLISSGGCKVPLKAFLMLAEQHQQSAIMRWQHFRHAGCESAR